MFFKNWSRWKFVSTAWVKSYQKSTFDKHFTIDSEIGIKIDKRLKYNMFNSLYHLLCISVVPSWLFSPHHTPLMTLNFIHSDHYVFSSFAHRIRKQWENCTGRTFDSDKDALLWETRLFQAPHISAECHVLCRTSEAKYWSPGCKKGNVPHIHLMQSKV